MLVVNAGYNPLAYKAFLEKIEKREEGKESTRVVSSTHPPYASRVSSLEKIIEEQGMNDLNYADGDIIATKKDWYFEPLPYITSRLYSIEIYCIIM